MPKSLHICKFFSTFVPEFGINLNNALYMNPSLKYFGVILLVLGVVCLIVYKYALPHNALLITSMVLEVAGILAYIFINKKLR